jgi:hypothetical protein
MFAAIRRASSRKTDHASASGRRRTKVEATTRRPGPRKFKNFKQKIRINSESGNENCSG